MSSTCGALPSGLNNSLQFYESQAVCFSGLESVHSSLSEKCIGPEGEVAIVDLI